MRARISATPRTRRFQLKFRAPRAAASVPASQPGTAFEAAACASAFQAPTTRGTPPAPGDGTTRKRRAAFAGIQIRESRALCRHRRSDFHRRRNDLINKVVVLAELQVDIRNLVRNRNSTSRAMHRRRSDLALGGRSFPWEAPQLWPSPSWQAAVVGRGMRISIFPPAGVAAIRKQVQNGPLAAVRVRGGSWNNVR